MKYMKWITLALALGLMLSACDGTGPEAPAAASLDGPETGAKGFYDTLSSGTGNLAKFACTSDQAAASGASANWQTGMKAAMSAAGVKIDASGMTYETISQSGDMAQVRIGGKFRMMVDGKWDESDAPAMTLIMKNDNGWKVCGFSM